MQGRSFINITLVEDSPAFRAKLTEIERRTAQVGAKVLRRNCDHCGFECVLMASTLQTAADLGIKPDLICQYCLADLPEEELRLAIAPSPQAMAALSLSKGRTVSPEEVATTIMAAILASKGKHPRRN